MTDFRGHNKIIKRPVWPFSPRESIIARMSIHMRSGYHQIPLSTDASFLKCFITPWRKFRYLPGPMGLAPTGDWFCFATDLVTNGIEGLEKSVAYVLATCESAEELEKTLYTFLSRCKQHGVTLTRKKFKCSTMIKYGGHLLDTQGKELVIKPDPEKLEQLRAFLKPENAADVQSLIEIVKTFDRWNLGLSAKCVKIRELHRKKNKFNWTEDHDVKFAALKQEILGSWDVIPFDLSKRIKIYTNAAKTGGIRYALCQPNKYGDNILVACRSTGLTDAQKKYAMVELELAAITFALENSRFYCRGAKDITVWTDHQALAELQNKHYDQIDNKCLVKLFEQICHYNVTIKYIPGPENAYALSHNPPDTAEVSDIPEMISYAAMIAKVNHVERKPIRLLRDLLEMAELGLHYPRVR